MKTELTHVREWLRSDKPPFIQPEHIDAWASARAEAILWILLSADHPEIHLNSYRQQLQAHYEKTNVSEQANRPAA